MIDAILDSITAPDAKAYQQTSRWRRIAGTWFSKTSSALRYRHDQSGSESIRYLLCGEAAELCYDALDDMIQLVPLLREDTLHSLELVETEARRLTVALKKHRQAAMLDNTEGRTPEEAAAFRAKAEELRA